MPRLVSINTSPGGIPKRPCAEIAVTTAGLAGDGHDHEKHRVPEQAISLLDLELLEAAARDHDLDLRPGSLGENLTLAGVGVQRLGAGDRLLLGEGDHRTVLEITRVRPPCYVLDVLSPDLKRTMWNRIGMYAAVVRPGTLRSDDPIEIVLSGVSTDRPLMRTPKPPGIDGGGRAHEVLAARGLPAIDPEVAR